MKVGIISDTHGNLGGFLDAIDTLRNGHNVAKLFFLGHSYRDLDKVLEVKQALRAAKRKDDEPTDFVRDLYDVLAEKEGIARARPTREQMEDTEWLKKHVVRVAGDDEAEGMFGGEQRNKEFEVVGGRIVCAVHNPKSLSKEDIASANMVVYGHTHLYQVDKVGGRYFLNPGHMMEQDDQGRGPTYALLDLGDDPSFTVYGTDGQPVLEEALELDKKRKFSVT